MAVQKVDVYMPMVASRPGPAPLVMRVGIVDGNGISEGVPMGNVKAEAYVLVSALPDELKKRVELAIQALIAGR